MFESKHSQSTAASENLTLGYIHSWNRPQMIEPATFNAIGKDLLALLPALESAGSPLADAYGRGKPEVGPEFIGFNGVACCGHASTPDVKVHGQPKTRTPSATTPALGERFPIAPATGTVPTNRFWKNTVRRYVLGTPLLSRGVTILVSMIEGEELELLKLLARSL